MKKIEKKIKNKKIKIKKNPIIKNIYTIFKKKKKNFFRNM